MNRQFWAINIWYLIFRAYFFNQAAIGKDCWGPELVLIPCDQTWSLLQLQFDKLSTNSWNIAWILIHDNVWFYWYCPKKEGMEIFRFVNISMLFSKMGWVQKIFLHLFLDDQWLIYILPCWSKSPKGSFL